MSKQTQQDPPQIGITITADKGHVADFLRQLANEVEGCEEDDYPKEVETALGCASFSCED